MKPVIFILGSSALQLAQQINAELNGEIHGPDTYAKATPHLAELFKSGRTIIGICAAGILIRALGAHLNDKRSEPPVLAVAEDGSSVIPLLGGHHGSNDLARRIAKDDDLTVRQDRGQRVNMVEHHAILEAVRAAGVFGDIAADGAGGLTRRVGGEVQAMPGDGTADDAVHRPRLDDRARVVDVDVENLRQALQADQHRLVSECAP